jgi:hypothetical protein
MRAQPVRTWLPRNVLERSRPFLIRPNIITPVWLWQLTAHRPCAQNQSRGSCLLCSKGEMTVLFEQAMSVVIAQTSADLLVVASYSTAVCRTEPNGSNICRSNASLTACGAVREGFYLLQAGQWPAVTQSGNQRPVSLACDRLPTYSLQESGSSSPGRARPCRPRCAAPASTGGPPPNSARNDLYS